jgi:Tfp pilus assembly pilus retraction ATPase PilT
MTEAYELTSAHPELEELQEFIDYEKSFDDTLSKAMEAVSKGEIKQTQSILAPYAAIPIFKPKIRECIRQASYNKIASLLHDDNIGGAKTIASYYLKEFGKDDEYIKLMKKNGLDT